jgi:Methyl-accepting chemotaxis protein (MCP) signalling domain
MLTKFTTDFQSKFNSLPFKVKATGAAVFLSLLPVVGVGTLAYIVSQNNLQAREETNQKLLTTTLSESISRFISLRLKDTQTLAALPLVKETKVAQSLTREYKENFLNDYLERYKIYDVVSIVDPNGNVIAGSKGSGNENQSSKAYFQAAKNGKSYISKVEINKDSKRSSIYFSTPAIDNITGQLIAIVWTRMPIASLESVVAPYGANENQLHVIDKNTNKFILATEKEQIGRDASDFASYEKLKNSEKPATTFDVDKISNKKQLISVLNVTTKEGLGDSNLGVIIAEDADVIDAKSNQVLFVLLLGMLAAGGATITLSLLLGNRATKFIIEMADTIVNSSGAIVDTVQLQELTVNLQANSAIETSTTVNKLGDFSSQSAEQAEASSNGARQALSLAEEGTKSVQQTLRGMTDLQYKVDNIAQQIVNLSEQTGQITIVSDLVADLASQTNMLALNAAVEAARAGEQGKGFSVVAGEIRKLADQSKKSADKINALAEDIQTAINRTVMVTDEGTKTVKESIDLAQETASTFVGVTDAINNVVLNSQQISTSAKQQAIAIQQVLSSMTMISQGSQESAVGMHQVKMTTRELTQVADELKAAVV